MPSGRLAVPLWEEHRLVKIDDRHAGNSLPLNDARSSSFRQKIAHSLRLNRRITLVVQPPLEPLDFKLLAFA